MVDPGNSVVDLVQCVDGHDHDHRCWAHGPGWVAGAVGVPSFGHEDSEPGAAVGHVVGRELGDVLVVGAAALGLDDREESIADVVDGDIGEPAAEMELVRDLVGGQGQRHTRLVDGGLGDERAEDFVERCGEVLWKRSEPDGLEQSERTNGCGEVLGPCSLRAVAVSDSGEHPRSHIEHTFVQVGPPALDGRRRQDRRGRGGDGHLVTDSKGGAWRADRAPDAEQAAAFEDAAEVAGEGRRLGAPSVALQHLGRLAMTIAGGLVDLGDLTARPGGCRT